MTIDTKLCRICGVIKPLDEYHRCSAAKDGHQGKCKVCAIQSVGQWQRDNIERKRATQRAYTVRHREALSFKARSRRAKKAAAVGVDYTTPALIRQRWAYYGDKCAYCGKDATDIDHRIPLSRGGPHLPSNLVPTCARCNRSKFTKTEREFRALKEARC